MQIAGDKWNKLGVRCPVETVKYERADEQCMWREAEYFKFEEGGGRTELPSTDDERSGIGPAFTASHCTQGHTFYTTLPLLHNFVLFSLLSPSSTQQQLRCTFTFVVYNTTGA